jgi:type II secretory pathway component PulF
MLSSGVPLIQALEAVQESQLVAALNRGSGFADALVAAKFSPSEALPFIRHGENQGVLDEGLALAARHLPLKAARLRYLAWTATRGGILAGFKNAPEFFVSNVIEYPPSMAAPAQRAEEIGMMEEFLEALAGHVEAGRLTGDRIRTRADAFAAMALNLKVGRILAEALPEMAKAAAGPIATALVDMAVDPTTGPSLSERMARHPALFNRVDLALVQVAELAGSLEQTFTRLSLDDLK